MNIKQKRGLIAVAAFVVVAGLAWLVISDAPRSVESLMAEAREYQKKGNLESALIVAKNVLQQDPTHAEARYLVGLLFMQNGEPRGAEHHFREALNLKYPPKEALPKLAEVLFEQGEFEKLLESTRSSD